MHNVFFNGDIKGGYGCSLGFRDFCWLTGFQGRGISLQSLTELAFGTDVTSASLGRDLNSLFGGFDNWHRPQL